jgi:hypothetical protein
MIWPLTSGGSSSLSWLATLFDNKRFETDLIVMTELAGLWGKVKRPGGSKVTQLPLRLRL